MQSMLFLPELSEFLKIHGAIYTVRKYKMAHRVVEVGGVGVCTRIPLGEIGSPNELAEYVPLSGFDSLETWVRKIRRFTSPGDKWYLYRVEVSV